MTDPYPLAPVRETFRAVARTVVPAAAALDERGWATFEVLVANGLSQRSPTMVRQLVVFVRLLDIASRLRFGRGLARLTPDRARALLLALESAPVLLVRRGVWGVRTLAMMGYYGSADVGSAIGYRAQAQGWAAVGREPGPWPERAGAAAPELFVKDLLDEVDADA